MKTRGIAAKKLRPQPEAPPKKSTLPPPAVPSPLRAEPAGAAISDGMQRVTKGSGWKAEAFEGKSVLITGGLGFIGSALARALLQTGSKVTVVDSLIPEYGGNPFNLHDLTDSPNLRINIADIRDSHAITHLVQNQHFLFNLAGQTSHLDSMLNPNADLEINCRSQLSLLEACRKFNPSLKILFASTRQLYGKPDYLPVDELHPIRPVDVNGINKMAGEWYHILYHNVYGLQTCALRLTNTYGPGMRIKDARQTFLGIWIRQILENQPVEIWGGTQLRDFTHVDDCVNALLLAAASKSANGEVFNLGGLETVTLSALGELLRDSNGSGELHIRDFPEERKRIDIGDYYSDWSKIQAVLGWRPNIPLADGLTQTLGYYRKHLPHYL